MTFSPLGPVMDEGSPTGSSTGSADLVQRYQAGDEHALARLWARYLPRLKKWAHGRLPAYAGSSADTDDLVQDAFVRSLARLRVIEPRGGQSLFAYFKKTILNQIRDYLRQMDRRRTSSVADLDVHVDTQASPFEQVLGREMVERYQRALDSLSEDDQDIVLAVVELGLTDGDIAELFEKPSIDAARMARGRGLARLARAMQAASTPGIP